MRASRLWRNFCAVWILAGDHQAGVGDVGLGERLDQLELALGLEEPADEQHDRRVRRDAQLLPDRSGPWIGDEAGVDAVQDRVRAVGRQPASINDPLTKSETANRWLAAAIAQRRCRLIQSA